MVEWLRPPWRDALLTLTVRGYVVRQHTIHHWSRVDRCTSCAAFEWEAVRLNADDEFECSLSYLHSIPLSRVSNCTVNLDGVILGPAPSIAKGTE